MWNLHTNMKPEDAALPDSPKRFTLKDIFDSDTFEEKTIQHPRWMKDNRRLSYLSKAPGLTSPTVWMLDTDSGETTAVYAPEAAEPYFNAWSPDETKLLFTEKAPARFSEVGNLWLYDIAAGKMEQVTNSSLPQRCARFSPDGSRIGFVRNENIWTVDLTSRQERQWTFDGSDTLYNGRPGWVYEEELGLTHCWEWSPDGKHIAFFQIDESEVPEVLLPDYDDLHMAPHRTRYPRAGDPNPIVKIGILNLDSGDVTWTKCGPDLTDENNDYGSGGFYISGIQWTPNGDRLIVQRRNRLQDILEILEAYPDTGEAEGLYYEANIRWVELVDNIKFLQDGRFLWMSEWEGWNRLNLHTSYGHLMRKVTLGDWDVDHIDAVDEEAGVIYFTAALPNPMERHLYRVSLESKEREYLTESGIDRLKSSIHGGITAARKAVYPEDGGEIECLTESTPGWNRALFSNDCSRFLHTHSTANQPPRVVVRDANGKELVVLTDDAVPSFADYSAGKWEFLSFVTSDGLTLNARILKPANFDPEKKYPVLMHTYGGPKSQVVTDQWAGTRALWYHLLAQQGYAIFMVDNRGTGGRGVEFKHAVYHKLGTWEVHDQIEGAKYLTTLSWVNSQRIGIWGWSYGGYMTSLCMMRGADVFRAGIAVAPVTDWRLYDSIYTERYMGLPETYPKEYFDCSPVNHADKLTGRFLLIHGLLDDNVHFQNSVRLANALQDNKRNFETMFYPGRRHGIDDRLFHLYMTMTEFLRRNL